MSRRRYLSTEISMDDAVNRLIREHGHFAGLFYTWLIPHAGDDGVIHGNVQELRMRVIPGQSQVATEDVEAALAGMVALGLIEWDPGQREVRFPGEKFYKYQTYIKARARPTPPPASPNGVENQRKSAQNTVSFSSPPSSSSSVSDSSSSSSPPPSRARETSGGGGSAGYGMTDDDDARRHEIYQAVLPSVNITGHAAAEHRLFALVGRWVDGDLAAEPDPVGLTGEWFDVIGHTRDSQMGRVTSLTQYAENHLAERQRGRPRLQVVRDEDPPDYPSSPVTIWNDLRDEVHRQTVSGELDKKFHFMSGDWGFQTFDAVSFDGHVLILTSSQAWDEHYRRNWAATLHRLAASRGQDIAVHWQEDGYAAVG
jgi:hypothetical protein